MRQRIGLGAAVGLVVAMMAWRGNQTAGVVSIFPDGARVVALALLLGVAVRFDVRRGPLQDRSSLLRSGLSIAAASGLVFGSAVVWLGIVRFSRPNPGLLGFAFLATVGLSMACGGAIAMVLHPGNTESHDPLQPAQ